jgi:phage terminase large subunit-like protein
LFGKWIRLAAKRFLADLKRAQRKRPPWNWSAPQANDACEFIESLPHVEGSWDSATIKLEPAQVFFIVNLFGFRRHDGTRRFTTALLAVARKNAKSTLAAAILLYVFCTEADTGPQVLSAATTGDQARIVWGVAKRMVEKQKDLREAFTLEPFANAIARYEVGGTFRPINAKASTQDGLNPSALSFDELHAHKTRDLYDVLRSAAGARKNPLFLYTTTEGYENPGPWSEVRRFAWQVLEGVVDADHFLALYYALDEADDDFDEKAWGKANPLLGVSIGLDKMREYAKEAKTLPGALAEFRIKRLNRPASAADGWIDLRRWKRCGGPVDLQAMQGAPCWAAFDLASTRDMTAWRLLWLVEGVYYTWGRYWVPESAVADRTERGTVPYARWIAEGLVTATPGDVTDYDVIQREILEDCARFSPREIAFDEWNASQIVNDLQRENTALTLVKFIQGPKSYNPAMKALEEAYTAGKLRHGGDPVLLWNAANLVPRRDANMNLAPDKKRSADKIDGLVALLMAIGRAAMARDTQSFWEQ